MTTRTAGLPGARTAGLTGARIGLLAGPTVLAFFTGGYFTEAQAWAGLVAWVLVAAAVALKAGPVSRSASTWVAMAGMGGYAAWTLASIAWAPIVGNAYHAGQLNVLYTGILLASCLLLASPTARSWVEPALALGALIVVGYGLSERLVPGALHFFRSFSAEGRLEQPLTYWNAMGELAAIGFVLAARLAGSVHRPRWMSRLAVAACVPLALGLYLSFSRGALFACVAGLLAVFVAAPTRAQLRALVLAVVAGVLVIVAAVPMRGVTHLFGGLGTREEQGAIMIAVLVFLMAGAAAVHGRIVGSAPSGAIRLPRRAPWLALALICGGLALAITVGAKETTRAPSISSGFGRLASLESDRYAYWKVALRAFGHEPLYGVGAGGWSVWWLKYRTVSDYAQDAHSLPLQTAAELGVVGLVFLGMLVGGVAVAARRAHRLAPQMTTGAVGGVVTYAAHAPLDWDWQMPALTLVAIVLAGMLLGVSDRSPEASIATPRRSAVPAAGPETDQNVD